MQITAIRRVQIDATARGVDEATAKLNKLAGAQGNLAVVSDKSTKAQLSMERALDRMQRQYDQAYRAQQALAKVERDLTAARAQGLLSQQRASELMQLAIRHHNGGAQAVTAHARAVQELAARAGGLSSSLGAAGSALGAMGPIGLAVGIALGAATLGFKQAADAALSLADRAGKLKDFSETTGVTIAQLQALEQAGSQVGVSADAINRGLERFSVAMDEAKESTGALYKSVREIDPALADRLSATTSLSESWDVLAEAMRKASIEQRNATARQAFGRGGIEMTRVLGATAGAGGLSGYLAQMQQANLITEQQAEHWDKLGDTIARNATLIKQNLTAAFAGPVLEAVNYIIERILAFSQVLRALGETIQNALGLSSQLKMSTGGTADPSEGWLQIRNMSQDIGAVGTRALVGWNNEFKQFLQGLGGAATPAERLKGRMLELAAGMAKGEISTEAAQRNLAHFRKELADTASGLASSNFAARSALGIITGGEIDAQKARELGDAIRNGVIKTVDELAIATKSAAKEAREMKEQLELKQSNFPGLTRMSQDAKNLDKQLDELATSGLRAIENGMSMFVADLAEGVSMAEALNTAMTSIGASLIHIGSQQIAKTAVGGIGSLLGQLGGGTLGGIGGGIATIGLGIGIQALTELFDDNSDQTRKTAEATKNFNAELVKLSDTINGVVIGSIQAQADAFLEHANQIAEEAQQATQQAADANKGFLDDILDDWFGMDPDPVVDFKAQAQFQKTLDDINEFVEEASKNFRGRFETSLRSLSAGLGFSEVAAEIERFGIKLREFIADTRTAFGGDQATVQRAVDASAQMALSFITGTAEMTELEKEMLRISEAAEAVKLVLIDLGFSADAATAAVTAQANAARAAAQAAEEMRIATQRMSLELRLLRATTDPSTLGGALALFDAQAGIELAEARADPLMQANLPLLEEAIAAERMAIIQDFSRQAIEAERRAAEERQRALEEAQRTLDAFSRNIRQFVDRALSGAHSPLSPQARLTQAQTAFNQQISTINTGSPQAIRDAMSSITSYAQDLIDAGFAFHGSSAAGQTNFNGVIAQLEALPDQISVQELILQAVETQTTTLSGNINTLQSQLINVLNTGDLDAIRTVLQAELPSIDTNTSNSIEFDELQAALGGTYNSGTLRGIFDNLDGNGNGILEKSELIRNNTSDTTSNIQGGNAILNNINAIQQTSQQLLSLLQQQTDIGGGFLVGIPGIGNVNMANNILAALNKIVVNTFQISQNTINPGNVGAHFPGVLAHGGWITGGVPGVDSVPLAGGAMLGMPGEFVVRRDVAQRDAAWLPEYNRSGRLPFIPANDNGVVAELRRSNAALLARIDQLEARLVRAEVAAAEHVGGKVDGVRGTIADSARKAQVA